MVEVGLVEAAELLVADADVDEKDVDGNSKPGQSPAHERA